MTQRRVRRPGFESPFPVAVSQVSPTEWELTAPLVYHGTRQTFTVPTGSSTDFASIPNALTWLVPWSTGIPAAVLHDHLWRREIPAGRATYHDADALLRQALGTLGVDTPRRYLMWTAVRLGSLFRPGGRTGWLRDAPAVLAIAIPGAILASPALLLFPSRALLAAAGYMTTTLRPKESS